MASANETSLPKGLESVLAKFVVQGQIDSKSSLDIAIRDLLEALRSANTDVASLLTAVTCRVDGLLEVVIASKSGAAFAFRSRILKALQKSTEYPKPIFITCTELIGAFLISGSSSVTVDQDVVDKHRKFSGEFPLHGLVEPSTTTLPGMHDSRASSVSLKNQAKGRHSNKSKRSTTRVVQQAPSPAIDSSERSATPSEQLEGCLESYFIACLEDGVAELAVDKLYRLLVPRRSSRSFYQAPEAVTIIVGDANQHDRMAQVLWDAGDWVNAALRFRQSNNPSSLRQASRCILEGVRSNVTLGASYGNESDILSNLFALSRTVALTPEEKDEIDFLRAVVHLDSVQLERYAQHFLDGQDLKGALLAFDAWSQSGKLDGMRSMQDDEIAEVLLLCHKFGTVVNTLVQNSGFVDLPGIQPIFGVSNTSSSEQARLAQSQEITLQRTVQPCSFVHSLVLGLVDRGDQTRNRADPVVLPTNTVDNMIRRALLRRLNAVVERVDELARKSRGFELCQQFLINQQCGGHHNGSCWKDHVVERDLTIERFNSQFRLHILIISVLDHFTATPGTSDEKARSIKQKIWLSKLFALCYPFTNKVGCLSDVTAALIPEYTWAMPIVQNWLREVFSSLRPADQVKSFLNNILMTSLLATAFNYGEAMPYLSQGKWVLDPEYASQNGLILENRPVVGSAISWLAKRISARTYLGVHFLTHILNTDQAPVHLDAEVALAFAEEFCAQLILNHYIHYAHSSPRIENLAMPRSWILRAFARASSLRPNGAAPWRLATVLDTFLNVLLLKKSAGKLQMRGTALYEVSYTVRSQAVQRVCRCLALIGQNHTGVRATVLDIFKRLGTVSPLRPEFQRFAQATDWDEVIDALVESTKPSIMDELLMIRRDVGDPSVRPHFKTVVCLDERDILAKLCLTQHPPVIALQSEIFCPGTSQSGTEKQRPVLSGNSSPKRSMVEAPQLESVASGLEERRSASIIQAFFRRHRRRAGGPIAAVFERLAKKLQERTRGDGSRRSLLLCIRGPLPHVLAYLRTFKSLSEDVIQVLNQDIQGSGYENIEELYLQGLELCRIRSTTLSLIKELQPSSNLYFDQRSATPVSVFDIVEKVGQIPELIRNLRNFIECPKDLDYELGVEPILSDRGPWARGNPALYVRPRPHFA